MPSNLDWELLERTGYFDLDKQQRRVVADLESSAGRAIEAWSLIEHPDVASLVPAFGGQMRHIVIIEAVRSRIYSAVREFLEGQKLNVDSFFSGGTADFVCDVRLSKEAFATFEQELCKAMASAGASTVAHKGNVRNFLTIYKVDKTLITGGKLVADLGRPDSRMIDQIRNEPTRFELVCRNYRSAQALELFGNNPKQLQKYLKELFAAHVVIGYRAVFDYSSRADREIVPLCHGTRPIRNLLGQDAAQTKGLFRRTVELFQVNSVEADDRIDQEVSHLFLNDYENPGDRRRWRQTLYELCPDDVNVFSYPLEGTLNQTARSLSDAPEMLRRVREYVPDIPLGTWSHAGLPSIPVGLPLSCLGGHGLTLGAPATGKTTTDLLLVNGVLASGKAVIVIDASGSVRGKHQGFVSKGIQPNYIHVNTGDEIPDAFKKALLEKGLTVLEPKQELFAQLVNAALNAIETLPDTSTTDGMRLIERMVLIEEARDAFAASDGEVLEALESCLNKAFRKGCAVWISTQSVRHLGELKDLPRRLQPFGTRLYHSLVSGDEQIVADLCHELVADRRKKLALELTRLPKFSAIVISETRSGGSSTKLEPIVVKISRFQ